MHYFFQICPQQDLRSVGNVQNLDRLQLAAIAFPLFATWCATSCYLYDPIRHPGDVWFWAKLQDESASWAFTGVPVETPTRKFRIDIPKLAKLQESSYFDASKLLRWFSWAGDHSSFPRVLREAIDLAGTLRNLNMFRGQLVIIFKTFFYLAPSCG